MSRNAQTTNAQAEDKSYQELGRFLNTLKKMSALISNLSLCEG